MTEYYHANANLCNTFLTPTYPQALKSAGGDQNVVERVRTAWGSGASIEYVRDGEVGRVAAA